MKIAIDHDGTISGHPAQFNEWMKSLVELGGHEVIVLTAGAGEKPKDERPAEMMRRRNSRGFHKGTHFTALACVEGSEKGQWCSDNGVQIAIDDEIGYLRDIAAKSPGTTLFHCVGPRAMLRFYAPVH